MATPPSPLLCAFRRLPPQFIPLLAGLPAKCFPAAAMAVLNGKIYNRRLLPENIWQTNKAHNLTGETREILYKMSHKYLEQTYLTRFGEPRRGKNVGNLILKFQHSSPPEHLLVGIGAQ